MLGKEGIKELFRVCSPSFHHARAEDTFSETRQIIDAHRKYYNLEQTRAVDGIMEQELYLKSAYIDAKGYRRQYRAARAFRVSAQNGMALVKLISAEAWSKATLGADIHSRDSTPTNGKATEEDAGVPKSKGQNSPASSRATGGIGDGTSGNETKACDAVQVHITVIVSHATTVSLVSVLENGITRGSTRKIHGGNKAFQDKISSILESLSDEELLQSIDLDTIETRNGKVPVIANFVGWDNTSHEEGTPSTISGSSSSSRSSPPGTGISTHPVNAQRRAMPTDWSHVAGIIFEALDDAADHDDGSATQFNTPSQVITVQDEDGDIVNSNESVEEMDGGFVITDDSDTEGRSYFVDLMNQASTMLGLY